MSSATKRVAVVGATGNQGGAVLRALLHRNQERAAAGKGVYEVVALTRNSSSTNAQAIKNLDPDAIVLAQCDLADKGAVVKALAGCERVFGVTNYWDPACLGDHELEYRHGINLVDACIESKVKQFVFSSLVNAEKVSGGKYKLPDFTNKARIEEYARLKSSESEGAFSVAFVQLGYFLTNFLDLQAPGTDLIGNGWKFCGPDRPDLKLPFVNPKDIGEIVAKMFESKPKKFQGKVVRLAASYHTFLEICALFTKNGQPSSYLYVPPDRLTKFAGPDVAEMAKFYRDFGYWGPEADPAILEEGAQLHGNMTQVEDWIQQQLARGTIKSKGKGFGMQLSLASSCTIS